MHRTRQSPNWWSYDDIAGSYEAIAVPHYFAPVAEELIAGLQLAPGSRLLDVGAGTAIVGSTALKKCKDVRAVGADLSLTMLHRAKERPLLLVAADILHQPFFRRSFDIIVASFVLNHVSDCRVALLELSRILRPAGQLAVTSWATGPSENALGDAWNAVASNWIDRETLHMAVTQALPSEPKLAELAKLTTAVEDAGLRVTQSRVFELPVRMDMASYIESRCIAMASRFMMTELHSHKWKTFKNEVAAALVSRFGELAAFSTKVNIVVAATRA
ncbi:MAG TPA: methyltransferase domain-containing protein [Acidobacteriota bacterium]|jgi:ubiquinone/menaquinone biosynthesis C-methylase UbiE|nr:methyltransferase domain-containing protein [Acidobacteriota bacterium]